MINERFNILIFWHVVTVLTTACYLYAVHIGLRRLQLKHNDVWVSLGKPSFPRNVDVRASMAFTRFVIMRTFSQCGDGGLIAICWTILTLAVLAMSLLIGEMYYASHYDLFGQWHYDADPRWIRTK